jgi:LacI family transcriptional regulator
MATIKQIARLAGISRGTVDRVLNNRGEVSPDTSARVLEIAEALNYKPNITGKILAVHKKRLKFGYILFGSTESNPFVIDVVRGIEQRAREIEGYGVTVETRFVPLYGAGSEAASGPAFQIRVIDELVESGIHGLVIMPINHPDVTARLRELSERGVTVVTANSDIPGSGRIAYVGSDYFKSGETAAGLMNLICGGVANVGVVTGSSLVLCHSERENGFNHRVKTAYPNLNVVARAYNNDDDMESFIVTLRMLEQHPEIDALFLTAAGVTGACRAIAESGREGKIRVVSYDATEPICRLIHSGAISASISQQPFTQGSKPLSILLDYLGMDIPPEKEFFYTKLEIKIRENL